MLREPSLHWAEWSKVVHSTLWSSLNLMPLLGGPLCFIINTRGIYSPHYESRRNTCKGRDPRSWGAKSFPKHHTNTLSFPRPSCLSLYHHPAMDVQASSSTEYVFLFLSPPPPDTLLSLTSQSWGLILIIDSFTHCHVVTANAQSTAVAEDRGSVNGSVLIDSSKWHV